MKTLALTALLALALSGCAVTTVATTAVDVGVGAASTAVDVSTSVAGHAARTVTGSDRDDERHDDENN